MKLFKYGLPLAALAIMASCTSENIDDPGEENLVADAITMSINIEQSAMTRTSTENADGKENGQTGEIEVETAYIILAREGIIISASTATVEPVQNQDGKYTAKGKFSSKELGDEFATNIENTPVDVYVVANYNNLIQTPTAGGNVQQTLTLLEDDETLWKPGHFLMTGSISKLNSLTGNGTESNPYNLGNIKIARAIARFDINLADEYIKFKFDEDGNKVTSNEAISLEFDGVALLNMSKTLNLFKEVEKNATTLNSGTAPSSPDSWIISDFSTYLENGTHLWVNDPKWGEKKELTYEFFYPAFEEVTKKTESPSDGSSEYDGTKNGLSKLVFADIENNEFKNNELNAGIPTINSSQTDYWNKFKAYRYCVPNTLLDKTKQLNGNSTAIVFRAKFKAGEALTPTSLVYTFGNYVFTDKSTNSETGAKVLINNIHDADHINVQTALQDAIQAAITNDSEKKIFTDGQFDIENMDDSQANEIVKFLVANGFAHYPVDTSGYCHTYYYYWNQHNNTGTNAMDIMEFGVVRNNIYKLTVTNISKLGHTANPTDDPDPIEPDDPDKEQVAWGTITCEVLQWDVRENDIEF